jgi:GT2 family glycosyltransferase
MSLDQDTQHVTIVIPNLNGERLLPSCLAALAVPTRHRYEVVLVDNASSDASTDVARQALPRIRVLALASNQGFAGACNRGAEADSRSRFVLFLNSDVRLTPNCLDDLVDRATSEPEAAIWQPKLLRADGRGWDSAGSYFTRTGFLWHDAFEDAPPGASENPRDIFAAKGACFLVRREAFEAVGGFDERFFAYFEETDLCWRVQLAGWSVRYLPVCCAYHDVGATTTRYLRAAWVDYLSFRNRIASIVKNAEARTLLAVLPAHLAACLAAALALTARGRWRSGAAILRAVGESGVCSHDLLQRRRRAQMLRTRPDSAFLPPVTRRMTLVRAFNLLASYLPRW